MKEQTGNKMVGVTVTSVLGVPPGSMCRFPRLILTGYGTKLKRVMGQRKRNNKVVKSLNNWKDGEPSAVVVPGSCRWRVDTHVD